MTDRLSPILARRRADAAAARALRPIAELEAGIAALPPTRGLIEQLGRPGLAFIAEMKRRSPAMGSLREDADAVEIARIYAAAGANALSILTEPNFFAGSFADLKAVRQQVDLPLLAKDFIVDRYHLLEARLAGADGALLIVAAIGRSLPDFLAEASAIGLDALVEIHNQAELDIALESGAGLIGINNRDLTDFTIDLGVTEQLRPQIPPGIVVVGESGILEPSDIGRMARAGVDAVLIGTALMSDDNPAQRLRSLIEASRVPVVS